VGKLPIPPHNHTYRQAPTAADKEAFDLLKNTPPSVESHPHTFAWFSLLGRFHESVRGSWVAAAPAKVAEKKAAPAKKEEPKQEEQKPAAGGDDDLDLFGDEEPSEVSQYIYLIGKLN
jgi:hypothetical protein